MKQGRVMLNAVGWVLLLLSCPENKKEKNPRKSWPKLRGDYIFWIIEWRKVQKNWNKCLGPWKFLTAGSSSAEFKVLREYNIELEDSWRKLFLSSRQKGSAFQFSPSSFWLWAYNSATMLLRWLDLDWMICLWESIFLFPFGPPMMLLLFHCFPTWWMFILCFKIGQSLKYINN